MQFASSPAFEPVRHLCEREPFAEDKNNSVMGFRVCQLILCILIVIVEWQSLRHKAGVGRELNSE